MDLPYNLIHTASENGDYSKSRPGMTLNQRRKAALEEVDDAAFSWYHAKVALVASVGFFTDAYDIFAINIAAMMLGFVYNKNPIETSGNSNGGDFSVTLPPNQDLGIKIATPVGTLVGQLLFGWLADVLGRKRMYGFELIVIILGCFGQVLAGQADAVNIINVIIVWRVIMGIGIGGDYPLSAVISSEFSAKKFRGRFMCAVFSAQGWGTFAAGIVSIIIVAAYKSELQERIVGGEVLNIRACDFMWRLLIGLGCIPACIALYFRLTIPESPRFTMDIERNVQQAADDVENFFKYGTFVVDPDIIQRVDAPRASRRDFFAYFSQWENLSVLLGMSWSWFATDVAFYGLMLNNAIIFQAIGAPQNVSGQTVYQTLKDVCVANIVSAIGGLIPGFYATMLFIDSWGRKPIQFMGFTVLTVLYIILGTAYNALKKTEGGTKVFLFLYCLASFFQNFGPNTTTFIIPGEAFPTRYRSTAHGISAASGKLGAIIAQVGFARLRSIGGPNAFVGHILEIFAGFMLTGIVSTFFIPETMNRSLEDMSNEGQDEFVNERGGIQLQQRRN